MRTYIIREIPDENRVTFAFAVDAMPTETIADYDSAASALAANPDLPWHEVTDEEHEEDEIAGDVLYVAEVRA